MQNPLSKHVKSAFITFLISVSLVAGPGVVADSAEISLNDDSVRLAGDWSLSNSGFMLETAVIHNEERGNVASVAALRVGDAGSDGLTAGVGLKLAYVDPDIEVATVQIVPPVAFSSPSGGALALGGKFNYVPTDFNRLNLGGYIWFAPDVLAFDKMDKYQEIGVYAGYNILRDADVFVGYRNVKGSFKSDGIDFGDLTIDSGVHLGIRVNF
ncbi:MAG: hypothetical protein HKN88_03705 [Gammaproteobacteria bacterium]|nr:YfaZ family protein [Gammaproteobacteria bacterium]NNC97160.1 hypothetical protein [Gammaproteobacteria bacterium]NNM13950.1 hypothetical protein [Gammaproteobacteria bacterium]